MLGGVKPWVWVVNAGRRTVRGLHPAWARPDDVWAEAWLPGPEAALYRRMDPRDRDHAVQVARAVLARHPRAGAEVVRAALLHDVGKSGRRYRVIERVATHLVRWRPAREGEASGGLRGAWQVAAHHARDGARLIREAGGSPRVAELVARHERPGGDVEAAWLRDADRRT